MRDMAWKRPSIGRRSRVRLIIQPTFAWLGRFRRLVVRYNRSIIAHTGFFHLPCAMLTLRMGLKYALAVGPMRHHYLGGPSVRSKSIKTTANISTPMVSCE